MHALYNMHAHGMLVLALSAHGLALIIPPTPQLLKRAQSAAERTVVAEGSIFIGRVLLCRKPRPCHGRSSLPTPALLDGDTII